MGGGRKGQGGVGRWGGVKEGRHWGRGAGGWGAGRRGGERGGWGEGGGGRHNPATLEHLSIPRLKKISLSCIQPFRLLNVHQSCNSGTSGSPKTLKHLSVRQFVNVHVYCAVTGLSISQVSLPALVFKATTI